jgi:putative drug exporter of the RND superfamily
MVARHCTTSPGDDQTVRNLTALVLRHRRRVALAWLVVALAAFALAGAATDSFSKSFALPGSQSDDVNKVLGQGFGNGGSRVRGPLVPVVRLPEGTTVDSPGVREEMGRAFAAIAKDVPGARPANFASTGDEVFISKDRRTAFGVIWYRAGGTALRPALEALKAARDAAEVNTVAGERIRITGLDALAGEAAKGRLSVVGELLVGGVFALLVLAFAFGSLTALLPLLIAAIAIPTTFLLLWPIAAIGEVSFVVQYLVALVGLGIAIDYSLLVVMRWREERLAGRTNREAVFESMHHAGRSVLLSGAAVAIGLLALLAMPVPFLRSIGLGGLLVPVVTVALALTLLPVLLDAVGPRLDRIGFRRRTESTQNGWVPWGRFVTRRRLWVGAAALVVLGLLISPLGSFTTGTPRATALAAEGSARVALNQLTASGIGAGVLTPYELVVSGIDAHFTTQAALPFLDAAEGVAGAVAPELDEWRTNDSVILNVFVAEERSAAAVRAIRRIAEAQPEEMLVGGPVPSSTDFSNAVYDNFIWILLAILVITFVLLARVFRSLLLPLKAVALNVLSICAVWGFLVYFWQKGNGSGAIFGVDPTGSLTVWIPLLVFAFLYGLSMDYEVFILSRMREEYDRAPSTDRAVILGVARTGRLVTAGSLILFGTFAALAAAPQADVKVFATGLAVGILIDATLVRGMLLPAVVSLFGRWNWWMPPWAARILHIEPHEPAPEVHDPDVSLEAPTAKPYGS